MKLFICATFLQFLAANPFTSLSINDLQTVCKLNTPEFWNFCAWMIAEARIVTVLVLDTGRHVEEVLSFTDEFFKNFYETLGADKPLLIKLHSLGEREIAALREPLQYLTVDENVTTKFNRAKVLDKYKWSKSRQYSGEPAQIYFVIVWDTKSLNKFLDDMPRAIIPNSRASYVILFLEELLQNLTETLSRLWLQFKVLNAIANAPCSYNKTSLYIYDPLKPFKSSWGFLKQVSIDQVLNDGEFLNSLNNFHGYSVNVCMFGRNPTAVKRIPKIMSSHPIYSSYLNKSHGFGGLDGCTLSVLATYLNFNVVMTTPTDGWTYGIKNDDGTFVGSLADVVYKKTDFSANGRLFMSYDTDEIEFTSLFVNDFICFLVPNAQKIPHWILMFHCFELSTWLMIILIFLVCLTFWLLSKYFVKFKTGKSVDVCRSTFEILHICLSIPVKISTTSVQKILLTTMMVLNIIIFGIFQGSIFEWLTTNSYYKNIDTLQELDASGLPIQTTLTIFKNDQTELIKRLQKKMFRSDSAGISKVAHERNIAVLERKTDAQYYIESTYKRSDGFRLIHIVEECPASYYISYIVPRGSPFLPRFNYVIKRLGAAGLLYKWYDDMVYALIAEKRRPGQYQNDKENPLLLFDIIGAFYLWAIGITLSYLTFLIEIFWARRARNIA